MKKKRIIITDKLLQSCLIAAILAVWQLLSSLHIVPKFLLPSPYDVAAAFCRDFKLILYHTGYTLSETVYGLLIGAAFGFVLALLMDRFAVVKKALYPPIIVSQTIPTVAVAPLLVLWMGYNMLPKITLVAMTTFFPVTVSLIDGFLSADTDGIKLLKAMGANGVQLYRHVKLPYALPYFLAGLRISVTYAVIGAVVAEWLGGFYGLGVYMTRARKSYSFDKMFAVIFFISALSLTAMSALAFAEKKFVKWKSG